MPSTKKSKATAQPPLPGAESIPPPTTTTGPDSVEPQPASFQKTLENLAYPAALIALAALASPLSQATLAPVFGAIPSAVNHRQAVVATSILAFTLRYFFKGVRKGHVAQFTAIWAFWVPVLQCYLFEFSGSLGPQLGPALLGFLSCHIILIPTVYAAAEAVEALGLSRKYGPLYGNVLPAAIGVYHLVTMESWFQRNLSFMRTVSGIFAPVTLQLIFASVYAALAPSKLLLFAIPGLLHTLYFNPHFDSPVTTNVLNTSLHKHQWSLLDRHWSNTGYISVLESLVQQYRVLRCDHSLLGGEWQLTPERQEKEGWKTNEPIYAAFEMLEAVRLMERGPAGPDSEAHALVIGLGVGTAPKALIAHGINTTFVELDHAIYHYALTYFGLPRNHTAIIGDAVSWVGEVAATSSSTKYDYIIHDVFTGGAEPLALFTDAFLQDLRSLLKPNGAIALNYAGDVTLPLTTRVLNTIDQIFHGRCKLYRDTPPESQEAGDKAAVNENFTNIVVFCRNSPGLVTFRRPAAADFLGSKSRQHYLLPDPKLEIQFPLHDSPSRSSALQDQTLRAGDENAWSSQQAESAIRHWYIMRKVIPDAVWELW